MDLDMNPSHNAYFSPTFTKRGGTTDRGKEYEHLFIANLILKLVCDDNIEDFHLASNDKNFGSFDDVVVEIKYRNKKEIAIYAFQLKQKQDKRMLSTSALAALKGGFSIKEYFDDYQDNKTLQQSSVKLILYTTCKLEVDDEKNYMIQILLNDETSTINFQSINQNELLKIVTKGGTYVFKNSESQHQDFFNKFVLCTSQDNINTIEKDTLRTFKEMFDCDESIFRDYVNFITKWSLIEGKKKKLHKTLMRQVIAIRVLSPFIKPLSFSVGSVINKKTKTFRQAISKFKITLINEENYDSLRKMWQDTINHLDDCKQLNQVRCDFQLKLDDVKNKEELNKEDKEVNIMLWLLGKCPIIVHFNPEAYKAIQVCSEKTFIILTRNEDISGYLLQQTTHIQSKVVEEERQFLFQTLFNLKQEKDIYTDVLENFTYSLEGQKEAPLKFLIETNTKLQDIFTTNELIRMVDGSLLIGNQNEHLPPCHIDRTLLKVLIDFEVLKKCTKKNIFLVCGMGDTTITLRSVKVVPIEDIDQQNIPTIDSEEQPTNNFLFVSKNECDLKHFEKVCEKDPRFPCHHLRYINNECLEWIESRGSVDDLQKFRLDDIASYTIPEFQLLNSKEIKHIICANPGMGKSTLMKNLKLKKSSSTWTVLICARNHALHFKKNGSDVEKFMQYILNESCKNKKNSFNTCIFEDLAKSKKMELVWDGLDEVSEASLQSILTIIDTLSKTGIKQWITSRRNLRDLLEKRLTVLSVNLKQFDEEEQNKYIKQRLKLRKHELTNVLQKIKQNILIFSYNDILGIPLQIYMLTELFHRNKEKYLGLLSEVFTIADLYEHFVDEKFNFYYEEKEKCDKNIEANLQKYEYEREYKISCYKQVAFEYYFESRLFKTLRSLFYYTASEKFLLEIKNAHDNVGFIVKVTEDSSPEFAHNSYGEYFAALYLSENYSTHVKNKNFIYDDRHSNICFFLDLILAKNCKGHVAVLHKNCQLLEQCTNEDLDCKDKSGRDLLEVACTWSKNWPILTCKKAGETFLLDESKFRKSNFSKNIDYKKSLKYFAQVKNASLYLKKLFFLLPFSLALYDSTTHCFSDMHIPTILFYAVIFDYSCVFDYFASIPLITLTSDFNKDKTLLDLILELKSVECFKKLVLFEPYINLLENDFQAFKLRYSEFHIMFKRFFKNEFLNSNLKTLMHKVCQGNHKNILHYLLINGTKVNISDRHGKTPLHYACEFADVKVVKKLLIHGLEISATYIDRRYPLHYARKSLDSNDSNPNIADINGKYPIHYATLNKYKSLKIIDILLKCGSTLNVAGDDGKTPLHFVVANIHYSSKELNLFTLVQSDRRNRNASIAQYEYSNTWIDNAELLIEKGANVNAVCAQGKSIMHYICEKSWPETLNFFKKNCFLDENSITGLKKSMCNCYYSHISKLLLTLVKNGVDLNIPDKQNKRPLHYSCEANIPEVTGWLIGAGARVDVTDFDGKTPLHYACGNKLNDLQVIALLLKSGAKIDVADKRGKLPKDYLIHYSSNVIDLILMK